ncbi:DNA-binding response regulator [Shinella sp. WSJ-2]|uniref:response regulator transcription factor n=1 Tax=Shinella sp. WSJ-2 TaxID=2303749 RepID=UPI0018F51CFE|nr:DNA-binding response regulator [Shinella sp. WSJ-2]
MSETASPRDIVLIVDDSPEALGFLTEALEKTGFSVLIATSGASALNIVDRITPDIILLDAVMPGLDGFETCLKLKTNRATSSVPVVFMTGLTETEHVVRALEAGGVDYLTKPINIDELRARIRVHLANARSALSARVALDAAGRHLLAVGGEGNILWSTPQATRLVSAAIGNDEGLDAVSAHIRAWMKTRNTARETRFTMREGGLADLQLSLLGAIGADEYLFRLTMENRKTDDDTLRQHFSLTHRESEVLLWISKGKSNRDIGEILSLSSRTVTKHLEQIYVKLGVENRASAAVKAIHVLHEA